MKRILDYKLTGWLHEEIDHYECDMHNNVELTDSEAAKRSLAEPVKYVLESNLYDTTARVTVKNYSVKFED